MNNIKRIYKGYTNAVLITKSVFKFFISSIATLLTDLQLQFWENVFYASLINRNLTKAARLICLIILNYSATFWENSANDESK